LGGATVFSIRGPFCFLAGGAVAKRGRLLGFLGWGGGGVGGGGGGGGVKKRPQRKTPRAISGGPAPQGAGGPHGG